MASIGIKFPFQETQDGGVFRTTTTTQESTRSNLISLLTTKRGQRVMHNTFYSPLFDIIMEPWDDISEDVLREELIEKITEFFEEIEVKKISFSFDEDTHVLATEIVYSIIDLGGATDSVNISVALEF
jgi:phage baseplate assembly protein W